MREAQEGPKIDFDALFASEVSVLLRQVLLANLCCQCEKPRRGHQGPRLPKIDFDTLFASEASVLVGQVLLATLCCQCEKPRRVQKLISMLFLQVSFLCF